MDIINFAHGEFLMIKHVYRLLDVFAVCAGPIGGLPVCIAIIFVLGL